jgi:hypothetical protein
MSGAPVRMFGWDGDREVWLAERDGEPEFVWVQDFGDAWMAAQSRGVELEISAALYEDLVAAGEAPAEPPTGVRITYA